MSAQTEAMRVVTDVIERVLLEDLPRPTHTPPIAARARFIARALDDADLLALSGEATKLRDALVEIDTYLANDPDVWRIVSVAKVGDVLCDVLGAETVQRINASVEANLCPKCAAEFWPGTPEREGRDE